MLGWRSPTCILIGRNANGVEYDLHMCVVYVRWFMLSVQGCR